MQEKERKKEKEKRDRDVIFFLILMAVILGCIGELTLPLFGI